MPRVALLGRAEATARAEVDALNASLGYPRPATYRGRLCPPHPFGESIGLELTRAGDDYCVKLGDRLETDARVPSRLRNAIVERDEIVKVNRVADATVLQEVPRAR